MEIDKDMFLGRLYDLDSDPEKRQPAVAYLFETFGVILRKGYYDKAREVVSWIDLNRLDLSTLLGIVAVTYPYSADLDWRPKLYKDVYAISVERKGKDYTHRLMKGLKAADKETRKQHDALMALGGKGG